MKAEEEEWLRVVKEEGKLSSLVDDVIPYLEVPAVSAWKLLCLMSEFGKAAGCEGRIQKSLSFSVTSRVGRSTGTQEGRRRLDKTKRQKHDKSETKGLGLDDLRGRIGSTHGLSWDPARKWYCIFQRSVAVGLEAVFH